MTIRSLKVSCLIKMLNVAKVNQGEQIRLNDPLLLNCYFCPDKTFLIKLIIIRINFQTYEIKKKIKHVHMKLKAIFYTSKTHQNLLRPSLNPFYEIFN